MSIVVDGIKPLPAVGGYQLEEELGRGTTGAVWRARRPGPIAQVVALKRLRAGVTGDEMTTLLREAEILTRLDHPHIVRVLEVVDDDDGLALVMQYAPGGSLEDLLAERGRLAAGEVVALAAPIADALASAHRRDVLHCDVKPANILFTSDGEPLLSDFGVARRFARPVTADQTVAGTAEYLAPELLDGGRPDARSDVYSLAVVCYEVLAGRRPYAAASPLAVVRAADQGRHAPLGEVPGVPRALASVVERAMARDPAARFASAAELAGALRASVDPEGVAVPGTTAARGKADGGERGTRTFGPRPPRPEPRPRRERHRPRRALVLAGALVALTVAAVSAGPARQLLFGDDDGPVTRAARCPALTPPPLPEGAELFEGDLDGDGCTSFVVRRGDVVEAVVDPTEGQPRVFSLGRPDDTLLLGDWDCDGVDTPGLYRPSTGEVFYFFEWARPGAPVPNAAPLATGQRLAAPEVGDDEQGCQEIVLRGGEMDEQVPGATGPDGSVGA